MKISSFKNSIWGAVFLLSMVGIEPAQAAGPSSGVVDKLFVQKGEGAVARTYSDKAQESISVRDFGAVGNGIKDDTAAINRAKTYATSSKPYKAIRFPAGEYVVSSTIEFDKSTVAVYGDGRNASTIRYVGNGTAVKFTDANPNNGAYTFGGAIRDIEIQGNANSGTLLYIKNVHHFLAENINLRESNPLSGICLQVVGTVAGHFKDIVCSTNAQLMSNRPQNGIVVGEDFSMPGARASANKFDNVIIEGMSGDGVQLIGSDQSVFIGGTSENNSGNGVTISAGSRLNTFISMGFENPAGFADVYDNGFSNRLLNCYSNNKVYVDSGSQFFELTGGYHQDITVIGDFATLRDLKYSFFAPGGQVLQTQNTSTRNLFNVEKSAITFAKKEPANVTVGASPFTYENTSGLEEQVVINNGAVTQIVFDRSGPVVNMPTNGGPYHLAPGDKLIISYTAKPSIVRIPGGSNFL